MSTRAGANLRSSWAWMAAAGVVLVATATASAQDAAYLVRGGQLPVTTIANGYVQTVALSDAGALVRVATALVPIGARGSYGDLRRQQRSVVPEGFALPEALDADLRPDLTAWQAATRVVQWVITHIEFDIEDGSPQDARSVLRRGRGRCSGLANLTTALLLAAGFEARSVSGLLIDDLGPIPHRWVECRLPDAGWVPTDPTLGLWTITPRHIAFSDSVREMPEVEVLALSDARLADLPTHHGRPLRPNTGSELVCRLVGAYFGAQGIAVLHRPNGETQRCLLQPEGRFTGLLPGRWLLVVELDGAVLERRELQLREGDVHSFVVHAPPGSELGS